MGLCACMPSLRDFEYRPSISSQDPARPHLSFYPLNKNIWEKNCFEHFCVCIWWNVWQLVCVTALHRICNIFIFNISVFTKGDVFDNFFCFLSALQWAWQIFNFEHACMFTKGVYLTKISCVIALKCVCKIFFFEPFCVWSVKGDVFYNYFSLKCA